MRQPRNLWPEQCLIWEASDPYLYLRTTPDGRIICGGEDEDFSDEAARDALLARKTATLQRKLARLIRGADTRVDFAWTGSFGTERDRPADHRADSAAAALLGGARLWRQRHDLFADRGRRDRRRAHRPAGRRRRSLRFFAVASAFNRNVCATHVPISPPPTAAGRPAPRSGGGARGVTAIASASAASWLGGSAFGSSTRSISLICSFSQWPAPTMVFFTRLGAYSATAIPARAGISSATPRAWPSLSVALASLLTKVASTAASSGDELLDHLREPVVDRHQPLGERALVAGGDRAAGHEDQPVAGNVDHAPAGAAEPGIDAENANRTASHRSGDNPRCRRMQSRHAASRIGAAQSPSPLSTAKTGLSRDRPSRQRDLCRSPRRAAHHPGDGGGGAGRAGARLFGLWRGDDLHAARGRDLRPADRRGQHPAGRLRVHHAVRHSGNPPLQLARGAAAVGRHGGRGAVRHLGAARARPDRAALVHRDRGVEPAAAAGARAGATTASPACRSPPASACSRG